MEDISAFRIAIFNQWRLEEDATEKYLRFARPVPEYAKIPEYTKAGDFVNGAVFKPFDIADTNVDVYDMITFGLGLEDPPTYRDLLTEFTEQDNLMLYRTRDFDAINDLRTYFYMEGEFPDSELEDEVEYRMGVCVYRPLEAEEYK